MKRKKKVKKPTYNTISHTHPNKDMKFIYKTK